VEPRKEEEEEICRQEEVAVLHPKINVQCDLEETEFKCRKI
jgi:hypothetical protein